MKPNCHPNRKLYIRDLCKSCYECERLKQNPLSKAKRDAYLKTYHQKNKDKINKYNRQYYSQNNRRKRYDLKRNYGLSLSDYEIMIKKQKKRCKICNQKMKRIHVDHCHKTNIVRGLLCSRCNTGIALMENDLLYKEAKKYLKI